MMIACAFIAGSATAQTASNTPVNVTVTIRADQPGPVINPNVYGQFAEHLGAGIYEGVWVGEKSADPEHQRLSQRRHRGAEESASAGGALARRLLRRRIPLARRHRRPRANAP